MHKRYNLKAFKIKKELAVQIPRSTTSVRRADSTDKPVANVDPQVYLQRCITVMESDKTGKNLVLRNDMTFCVFYLILYTVFIPIFETRGSFVWA